MDPSINTLLRLGMNKKQHAKLFDVIPPEVLDGHVLTLWTAQDKFYKQFPDIESIKDVTAWQTWLSDGPLSRTDDDTKELILLLAGKLGHPVDASMTEALTNMYLQQAYAMDAMSAVEKFSDPSNETDLMDLLEAAKDKYKDKLERTTQSPIENTSIDDLYAIEENNIGFKWRLPELQQSMRPLRPSDSIIWAARPDRGKTTTVASEVSWMVRQLDEVYPDENKCFIWFNNEGDSKDIRRRLYQAALGVPRSRMLEWHKDGTLLPRLHEAFGGKHLFDRILIMSIHGYSSSQVLRLIKEHKPGLIVFDMVDNIRFNGLSTNGGTRTDQMLEEMYRWVRDHANIDQYAAISTSQISGDGEGVRFPNMSMLKDSKTGKQGACEAIVMWGEDPTAPTSRFLGIPKNKLCLEGMPMNPKKECFFQPEIARVVSFDDVAEE